MPKDELLEEIGDPAHAGPAQVRAARARRAEGRAAPGEGHAAPRGVGGPRRARARSSAWPSRRLPARRAAAGRGEDRPRRLDLASASTTSAASSTRSRTAARTTTARSARATSTSRRATRSARGTARTIDIRTRPRAHACRPFRPVETFPVRVDGAGCVKVRASRSLMLDERVRAVLERLEARGRGGARGGLPRGAALAPGRAPTTGRFLFSLVAPQPDCEVLEIGGSRGYSTIWLAAGVRHLGGRVLSLEHDPAKCEAWRRNIADAGLEEWAELVEGDALESLPAIEDVFDVVFLDAEKDDYERLFAARAGEARAGRARRRRQRPLARRDARRVLAGPPGRPDARERDRPARPRARGVCRPAQDAG